VRSRARTPGARAHCASLDLGELDELDVADLIRGYGIARPGRELVATLYEASRGNPLYIREVLRRLQTQGAFSERAGLVEAQLSRKELRPPRDLVELIEHRLEALPPPVAGVLLAAALLGEEFDPGLLASVLDEDVRARLAAAVDAELLVERGARLGFAHALVRQVACDQLPTEQRRALHARVAARLRADPATRGHTLEIAHHLLESDAPGDAATLEYLSAAGLQAHRAADWRSAIRCFDAALALGERLGAPAAQLGWLRYWSGCSYRDDYDAPRAVELLREAAAIGKRESDVELWARSVRDEALHRLRTSSASARQNVDTRALDEALGAIDATRPELRISLLSAACTLRMTTFDFDAGLALGEEAVRLAALPSGAGQRANAESTLGMALLGIGAARRACEHLDRARLAAREADAAELEAYSLARLALALWMLGRTQAAGEAAEQAGADVERLRHHRGQCLVSAIRAALAVAHGDFEAAERWVARDGSPKLGTLALLLLYPALFEARTAWASTRPQRAARDLARDRTGRALVSAAESVRGPARPSRGLLAREPRYLVARACLDGERGIAIGLANAPSRFATSSWRGRSSRSSTTCAIRRW
jgi:tetratricopeptide (TPR) repeat protein